MAGQFIIGFFAAILLGAVLLVLGIRGRCVNRNPTCRSCGFDLSGILPDGVTCPECGAGLKRDKAVRIGQRKRMWAVAAIGLLFIVLPAGGLATAVYAVLTGADINTYKPFGLLMWEASRTTNADASAAYAKEFMRRRSANELDEAQAVRVIETALTIQADPAKPWAADWGDFIEMSQTDGLVVKDQYQLFLNQAVILELETRPKIETSGHLPLAIGQTEARVGSGTMVPMSANIDTILVDGEEVEPNISFPGQEQMGMLMGFGMAMATGGSGFPVWSGFVAGDNSPWGMGMSGEDKTTCLLQLPKDIKPGTHTIEVRLKIVGQKMDQNAMGFSSPTPSAKSRTQSLTSRFEIVAPGGDAVEVIDPTEDLTEQITDVIGTVHGWVMDTGLGGRQVQFSIDPGRLPCDLSTTAFLRLEDRQLKLGDFVYHQPASQNNSYGMGFSMQMNSLSGRIGKADITGATLVLIPDPALARQTTDITRVYGGQIVIADLQIEDMAQYEQEFIDEEADQAEGEADETSGDSAVGGFLRRMLGGG